MGGNTDGSFWADVGRGGLCLVGERPASRVFCSSRGGGMIGLDEV